MISALLSLAMQAARLIPRPRMAHRGPRGITPAAGEGRSGYCPVCQGFISLGSPDRSGLAACPRCGRQVAGVEPLS